MTNYMKKKLEKLKWRYQLHDDLGCIREFRTKEDAEIWSRNRLELKMIIVKPKKFRYEDIVIEDNFNPYDIPF